MDLQSPGPVLDWPFARPRTGLVPPILAELRSRPPCRVRIPLGAAEEQVAWLVTRHPDVRQALMDPRLSADETLPGAPVRIQVPQEHRPGSFLRMDDPEHTRLRGMIATSFTARRVRAMRDDIQRLTDLLLDDLEASDRPADLHDIFCRKLPTLVVARMLGVPDEDSPFLVEQTRVTISQGNPEVSFAAYQRLSGYLADLAGRKATDPGDDLISMLVHDQLKPGQIELGELVGVARLVLVAGHETTTNQIALNVLSLLVDDDLRDTVLTGPETLVPEFVEESMRYWSISQDAILRLAIDDLELGGVRIAKGDPVVISIPAGNHDPAVFPDPERIDPRRDTSEHLQWGVGPHRCQGAPLATLEMDIALRTLFARFPGLRLATADVGSLFRRGTVFHGVDTLPVTW